MAEPEKASDDVRLILLDQQSLNWAAKEMEIKWPWPREVYQYIIDYCKKKGAKSVAFDVIFSEPSEAPDADKEFGKGIADYGHFTAPVILGNQTGKVITWPSEIPVPALKVTGLDSANKENYQLKHATFPIPEVAKNSVLLSSVNVAPDKDGIYRRTNLLRTFDGKPLPTLGLGCYLAAHPDAEVRVEENQIIVDNISIPIDKSGRALLRYRGPSKTHRAYSAAAVLQSAIREMEGEKPTITEEDAFKDKYIFFGFSAPALHDQHTAPVDENYPGVEVHTTMLDNLLSDDFIAPVSLSIIIGFCLMLTMICGYVVTIYGSAVSTVLVSLTAIPFPVGLSFGFYHMGYQLPMMVMECSVIFTIILAVILNYATEGRQKRFIKHAFVHYLNSTVLDQLMKNPDLLKLGGERREISIIFTDLEGFTTISERLEPEVLIALLNEYLSAMAEIILEEEGTIDKYEGDAIIAFWNAPSNVKDHAIRVTRAALRCQEKLKEMQAQLSEKAGSDLLMRIGINTGNAVVGNLGSKTRFDYTMMGDSVNLAARLEGVNKQFGSYTIIAENTRHEVGNAFAARELGRVGVVGRKEPVTIYEPMFHNEYKKNKAILEKFAEGLQQYYKGDFNSAREIFQSIETKDAPSKAYAEKCQELSTQSIEEWNGVWVMNSK